MKVFKNSFGFSMVEALVGIGLLGALGLGAMKLSESQKKAVKGQKQASELPRTMVMIKQLASEPAACEQSFKGKSVTGNLTELKDAQGAVRLKTGDTIGKGEYRITSIKLDGYSEDTNRARLAITLDKLLDGTTSSKVNRFTFIHVEASGGTISKCLDPSEMSSDSLAKRFCKDIDPQGNDNCEDNLSNILVDVKSYYCGNNHPFLKFDQASGKCLPLDANKACASGFIKGYDATGNLVCGLPATKKTATPKVCSSWSDWTPATSGTCSKDSLTQTRSCTSGTSETENRTVTGTKDCPEGCSEWNDWTPLANTQCPDINVTQTRSCKSGTGNETRVVKGEKSGCNTCKWEVTQSSPGGCGAQGGGGGMTKCGGEGNEKACNAANKGLTYWCGYVERWDAPGPDCDYTYYECQCN